MPKPLPGDRPIISGKPFPGDRPINVFPGVKPFPGDRPVIGVKPGIAQRPEFGVRPGGGHVSHWVGNDFNVNLHPGMHPSWGYGSYHWGHHWHDHHVHHHHYGWYHGCWSGHWGRYWYVPAVVGATYWGFGAVTNAWGYNYYYGYVNPYYTAPVAAVVSYNYSQPIVINTYVSPEDSNAAAASPAGAAPPAAAPPETASEQAGYRLFDQAREAFRRADFRGAQRLVEQALKLAPNDPVLHEFYALCLFANRQYEPAAAVLNPLLAVAPGMDWTTLSSLYASIDEYTRQLRALETHCTQQPNDSAAAFVMAYHYLICGHAEDAKQTLDRVVKARPNDQVALRMRKALEGSDDESPAAAVPAPAPAPTPAAAPAAPTASPAPSPAATEPAVTTDLIGTWRAERDGTNFELAIDDQGQFRWKATPPGKPAATITGEYSVSEDTLVMDGAEQGTMAGRVASGGADQFQFVIAGGPPGDTGLAFQRVKSAK
jgi:tetratricopeptide (TPR) repeat protein